MSLLDHSLSQKEYALWLMPEPGQRQVQLYRLVQRLAEQYGYASFLPHLTLVRGSVGDVADSLDALRTRAEDVATCALEPVELTLNGICLSITDATEVVYLSIEPSRALTFLRKEAHSHFQKPPRSGRPPRVSLAYGTFIPEERRRIISSVNKQFFFPIQLTFAQIVLYDCNGPPSQWRPVTRSMLRI